MKALSIRQPWAWLIIQGYKDVENRTRKTNYRGPLLIHAGKRYDIQAEQELVSQGVFDGLTSVCQCGGIVGIANLVDCVTESDSPWFTGPHGLVLENARPVPFAALKGRLGLFQVQWDLAGDCLL